MSRSDSRRKKKAVAHKWVPGVSEEKGREGAQGGKNRQAREGVGLGPQATRPRGGLAGVLFCFFFFLFLFCFLFPKHFPNRVLYAK